MDGNQETGGGDPIPPPRGDAGGVGKMKKKGSRVQAWLVMEQTGEARFMEVGKKAIIRRTGIPARDLRILDPALSQPSRVLGREKGMVVNLEHIKAIITAKEAMFLNSKDPLVSPFIEKLQGILRHLHTISSPQAGEGASSNVEWRNLCSLNEPHSAPGETENRAQENENNLKLLPFEFVALEACLQCVCLALDNEAKRLEQEAHPALDSLVSKISSTNVELVRNIKGRLVALTGRVQKVRDELENLLDDDQGMAAMYLTDKLQFEASSLDDGNGVSDEEDIVVNEANAKEDDAVIDASPKRRNVEGLEMILDAYFVQIQGTLQTLTNLREYVDDTEDYISIMLDDRQNSLLRVGILISTGTMLAGANVALSGLFAMNIQIELYNTGTPNFLGLVVGSTVATIALFVVLVAFYKHKRLL